MDLLFVPTDFLQATATWFSAQELTERQISPVIESALRAEGLLTDALQNAYAAPASVECRRQTAWQDALNQTGLRRDVLIKTGELVRVVAATLMPHDVLARYPWLGTLGSNPLGAMLEKHARYQRGAFEFTQLDAQLLLPAPVVGTNLLWARRYRFFLAESSLLVTEIFLAGVLERLGAFQ
jgi:chorismate-pyruvate lyase